MEERRCAKCGIELTEENSYERADGISRYCVECEDRIYMEFAESNGYSIALWMACAKFNVRLEPLLIPEDFGTDGFAYRDSRWSWYNEALYDSGKYVKENGELTGFKDGVTMLFRIFGKELTEKDFSRYCRVERERMAKLPGTEEQRTKWGTMPIWKGFDVSTQVYDELDRAYEARTSQYKGQTITDQIEMTLRRVCKLALAMDYLQSIGDAHGLDKVQKSIDSIMASEQLRKKDEKPVEALRLDALVDAMEKAGVMEEGKLLNCEQTIQALEKNFICKPKYHGTIDVVDQSIMDMMNSMRANADLFMLNELPEELMVEDTYGEFDGIETDDQRKRRKYAGLMPLRPAEGETKCRPDTQEKASDTQKS